jgi:hypothetical protein
LWKCCKKRTGRWQLVDSAKSFVVVYWRLQLEAILVDSGSIDTVDEGGAKSRRLRVVRGGAEAMLKHDGIR